MVKKIVKKKKLPLRATVTKSKRTDAMYRDTSNVEGLKKFHRCANEPHSSGCKKSQREKKEKEDKDRVKVKGHGGRDQSTRFSNLKKKYTRRGKKIGDWTVSKRNVPTILKQLAKDRQSLVDLGEDEAKLITNWQKKVKQQIKSIVDTL